MLNKVVSIIGPTATGKSALAISIAKKFNGEIISADSRQVYKGLNIGTGKVTKKEMSGIPHHLLDVVNPKKQFTVEKFKKLGQKIIEDILSRGKIPIIAGGTGFYIDTLLYDTNFHGVPPNTKLRIKLKNLTTEKLFKKLQKLDLKRAQNIDSKNTQRLIRAIEIAERLGNVPNLVARPVSKYGILKIGLTLPKDELRMRINLRLKKRIAQGMIAEVKNLHKQGLSWKRMFELGLEYRYLALCLTEKISKEEMIKKLETEIWRYSKRQMTWFKRDKEIKWFEPADTKKIKKEIENFLISEKVQ